MTVYFEQAYAKISYNEENKLVEVELKDPNVNSTQYCLTLSKALVVMKEQDAEMFITDISKKGNLSVAETEWVENYFIPSISDTDLKKWAFVSSNSEATDQLEKSVKNEDLFMSTFANREDAMEWFAASAN